MSQPITVTCPECGAKLELKNRSSRMLSTGMSSQITGTEYRG